MVGAVSRQFGVPMRIVGDWNAILDPKIDKAGRGASGLDRCESCLVVFIARFNLVDKIRPDHPGREMWTWTDSSPSVRIRSKLNIALGDLTRF